MRIGVTISRDWDDYGAIEDALYAACEGVTHPGSFHKATVVHGASHMDFAVAGIAYMLGMNLEAHPADWLDLGKGAGPRRNQEMVDLGADIWLAFIRKGSRGASDCAARAEAAGIPVRRYES